MYLENYDARYYVGLYIECRKTNSYPSPGGPIEQTGFTNELFDYLDSLFAGREIKNASNTK